MTKGKTGEICQQSGVYRCSLHSDSEIALSKGNKFPPCNPYNNHGAIWILVRPT